MHTDPFYETQLLAAPPPMQTKHWQDNHVSSAFLKGDHLILAILVFFWGGPLTTLATLELANQFFSFPKVLARLLWPAAPTPCKRAFPFSRALCVPLPLFKGSPPASLLSRVYCTFQGYFFRLAFLMSQVKCFYASLLQRCFLKQEDFPQGYCLRSFDLKATASSFDRFSANMASLILSMTRGYLLLHVFGTSTTSFNFPPFSFVPVK